MSINFEEIPSDVEVPVQALNQTKTVLDELNSRQYLLNERSIKCGNIKPFYMKTKTPPHRYSFKYFCICPRYNPQYVCKHTGNIIVDRDVLTPKEHILYLATPKATFASPRQMPRYILKKSIVADCTDRIIRLAKPDLKQVNDTLNNFNDILSKRHKKSLENFLEKSSNIEYTSIQRALDLLSEEKRLKKVAKRKERLRYQKLSRKIVYNQKQQIKKIIGILFEEMKEFLLNDQFATNDNSTLETVILEALKEFTDKEFHITNNLREYQKILAFNLSAWINGFISNLNIHVAERAPQNSEISQPYTEKPTQESMFLPVSDYIPHSNYSEGEDEDYYSYHQATSERTTHNKTNAL